jgi:NifB/MoaA-like Fe-S oxidoreductase
MTTINGAYKIVQYDIIRDIMLDNFIKRVNEAISDGWEPLGFTWGNGMFSQTMVKRALVVTNDLPVGWVIKDES